MYDRYVVERLFDCAAAMEARWTVLSGETFRDAPETTVPLGPVQASTVRGDQDDADVRRLILRWAGGSLELQPTKGLTIGPCTQGGWKPFWEPVVPGIISPDREDLLGELLVEGSPVAGMRWIENFSGCVEMLGLSNWGMPRVDERTGVTLPLHGEAARVPVDYVAIGLIGSVCVVAAEYVFNSRWWNVQDTSRPWYRRGCPDWRIVRTVAVDTMRPELQFVDSITNCTEHPVQPQWGYHVQLRAETGARLEIPAAEISVRGNRAASPGDYYTWRAAADPARREERGYILRGIPAVPGPFDTEVVHCGATYPDGESTEFTMPAAACTLSWFSCGGSGSLEFALPESPERSLLPVGWDGMGPEIGTAALDHDDNFDPAVVHRELDPGETTRLYFSFCQKER